MEDGEGLYYGRVGAGGGCVREFSSVSVCIPYWHLVWLFSEAQGGFARITIAVFV